MLCPLVVRLHADVSAMHVEAYAQREVCVKDVAWHHAAPNHTLSQPTFRGKISFSILLSEAVSTMVQTLWLL